MNNSHLIKYFSVRTDLLANGAQSRLHIAGATFSDSGNYTCMMGRTAKTQIELQIIPGIASLFLLFIRKLFNTTNMVFVCCFLKYMQHGNHMNLDANITKLCVMVWSIAKLTFGAFHTTDWVSIQLLQITSHRNDMVKLRSLRHSSSRIVKTAFQLMTETWLAFSASILRVLTTRIVKSPRSYENIQVLFYVLFLLFSENITTPIPRLTKETAFDLVMFCFMLSLNRNLLCFVCFTNIVLFAHSRH